MDLGIAGRRAAVAASSGGLGYACAAALAAHCAEVPRPSALGGVLDATTGQLDAVGSSLQVHAQDLATAAGSLVRLQERVAAAGLVLHAWTVSEPYGPVSAEVATQRAAARPALQAQADRLAASVARSRAHVNRLLACAQAELAAATSTARAGH